MMSAVVPTSPSLGLFLQLILRSSQAVQPITDILIIYDSYIWMPNHSYDQLIQASSGASRPVQVWNFGHAHTFYTFMQLIDLRTHSSDWPHHLLLIVSVCSDVEQLQQLLYWQSMLIVDYYVHSHLMIVSDATTVTCDSSQFQEVVMRFFPYDSDIRIAGFDGNDFRVLRDSGDLRHNGTAENLTFRQRFVRQRDRRLPMESIVYRHGFMPLQRDRDRPYVRLLAQYFGAASNSSRQDVEAMPNQSVTVYPAGTYGTSPRGVLILPRLGRYQYALIVPNWWHHVDESQRQRRRQTMVVFVVCAALFASLVAFRGCSIGAAHHPRRPDRGGLVLDMWARVLGMASVELMVERRSTRRGTVLRQMPLVSASVWGLLNGMTMTTLLLDVALSAVWTPVFGSIEDVCLRAEMPIVFDDGIIFTKFISVLDEMRR